MADEKRDFVVHDGTPEAIAYLLMERIGGKEALPKGSAREYWLTLYRECLAAVQGRTPAPPATPDGASK